MPPCGAQWHSERTVATTSRAERDRAVRRGGELLLESEGGERRKRCAAKRAAGSGYPMKKPDGDKTEYNQRIRSIMEDQMRFAATPLQILVAAIPNAALRPLLIELLQNGAMPAAPLAPDAAETTTPAPATRRRGWPRGKPRKTAAAGETAAERTARLARHAAAQRQRDSEKRRQKLSSASGSGNGGAEPAETALAAKLWQRATTLSPAAPWKAVVQEFGVNSALALDHFRRRSLPPVAHAAVTRFVEAAPAS
jgi:hypothetical protein